MPIRRPILHLATIASLLLPALAQAQSSQGSIGVAATILPAPPAPLANDVRLEVDAHGNALVRLAAPRGAAAVGAAGTPAAFLRVTRGTDAKEGRVFVAPAPTGGVETVLRLPATARDSTLRVERLIVAGT